MKELVEKNRQGFKELIETLPEEKYPTSKTYIENLSKSGVSFFDVGLTIKPEFL